jgi:hypothetical protein
VSASLYVSLTPELAGSCRDLMSDGAKLREINVTPRAPGQPDARRLAHRKGLMLDLAYLALGLGVLALFGLYAAALRRL